MVTSGLGWVVLVVVSAYSQHCSRGSQHRNDVRNRNSRGFAVFFVLVALQIKVHVALVQLITVVVQTIEPRLFVFALLNLVFCALWLANVHISVEPSHLKLTDLVFGLVHPMRYTLCGLNRRGAVGNNHVLGWNKQRRLPLEVGIVKNFLKSTTCSGQIPQHPLVL